MSRMRTVSIFVTLAAIAAMSSAQARPSQEPLKPESQVGTRFPSKPTQTNPEEAGVVRKSFARCLYNRAPARVDKLLENSDPEGIEYYAAGTSAQRFRSDVGMDYCLHVESVVLDARQLTMSNTAFRSMMLEEAYLARFNAPPALPEGASEVIADRRYITEGATSARSLGRFADCLAFHDAAGADALLRTMPGSAEEKAAARAMAPALGACLTRGQTLSLNTANVRAFAADGLWTRFARGAGPVPAQSN